MYLWIIVLIVLNGGFWFASQYFPEQERILLLYFCTTVIVCVLFFLLERAKRRRLVQRIAHIFDKVENESELSPDKIYTGHPELRELERQVMQYRKKTDIQEMKLRTGYARIASLVSDIAHQCRTPLSSILLYVDALPDPCKRPGECGAVIHSQAEKLGFLMDALTKLSKCESGLISANLAPSSYSVTDLICCAVTDIFPAADGKNIDIVTDSLPENPRITAVFDMRWTKEALFNILDNAVKYAPVNSIIRISVTTYDLFVCIDVTDAGPGIPESDREKIWQRFYRGDIGKDTSGVGIGLYITQCILSSEGGYAAVRNSSSSGTTFSVFLPRKVTQM